jgi:AcrR family transcriptional regulator
MGQSNTVREQMIRGAATLLASNGVQGTSLAEVLALTGAPRGSIYHHFPGGKDEMVHAALTSIGDGVASLLDALDGTPAEVVGAFVDGWQTVLVGSDYRRGCAVAATTLDATDDPDLLAASASIFSSWRAALGRALQRGGMASEEADDFAALCLATVEGALVLGRAVRDDHIFTVVRRLLVACSRAGIEPT